MTSYIRADLRRAVIERAGHVCEYCLIHESDTYLGCQVDHVLSEKHGGLTDAENLCLACTPCNRAKGSDIASITKGAVVARFYNPRTDTWKEHFRLDGVEIAPLTEIGEVTVRILEFNAFERILEREKLACASRYPSPEAVQRIT